MNNESYEDTQPDEYIQLKIERMMEDYLLLRRQEKAPTIEAFIKRYPEKHRQALREKIEECEQLHLVFSALQQYQAEKIASELSDEQVSAAYRKFQEKVAAQPQPWWKRAAQALRLFFLQLRRAWAVLFPSPRRVAFASLLLILIVGLFLVIRIIIIGNRHYPQPVIGPPLELQAQLVQPITKGASSTTPPLYHSGDILNLSLNVTQEAYIYVVWYSSTGKAELFFPHEDIDLPSKLEPKRDFSIPFVLDQNTGMETIFILASRHPESDVQNVVRFIEQEASTTKETYLERIKHVANLLSERGFVVRTISFEHRAIRKE